MATSGCIVSNALLDNIYFPFMHYTLHISVLLEMVYGLPQKLFGGLWNYRHITNPFGHVSGSIFAKSQLNTQRNINSGNISYTKLTYYDTLFRKICKYLVGCLTVGLSQYLRNNIHDQRALVHVV